MSASLAFAKALILDAFARDWALGTKAPLTFAKA
jgi:hypothetical protein